MNVCARCSADGLGRPSGHGRACSSIIGRTTAISVRPVPISRYAPVLTALAVAHRGPATSRPAPQSLRRLFHDENSSNPDPFASFSHQQPGTPSSTDGASLEDEGRLGSPPSLSWSDAEGSDLPTVRLAKRPAPIAVDRDAATPTPLSSGGSSATFHQGGRSGPTSGSSGSIETPLPRPPGRPSGQLRGKASFDTLSSAPTSRSQPPEEARRGQQPVRRPGGSVGDGLRGFQFPLVHPKGGALSGSTPIDGGGLPLARPAAMSRNHSAAPALAMSSSSYGDAPGARPVASMSTGPPQRPAFMRQASVAVMEGRAQAQAQAQALAMAQAQANEPLVSPIGSSSVIGLPRPPVMPAAMTGGGAMMRSRSGSRIESDSGSAGPGLRELIKVGPV